MKAETFTENVFMLYTKALAVLELKYSIILTWYQTYCPT